MKWEICLTKTQTQATMISEMKHNKLKQHVCDVGGRERKRERGERSVREETEMWFMAVKRICFNPTKSRENSSESLPGFNIQTHKHTNTATQTEMRGTKRHSPTHKQTRTQSGPWESAMREQVSLFTCSSLTESLTCTGRWEPPPPWGKRPLPHLIWHYLIGKLDNVLTVKAFFLLHVCRNNTGAFQVDD